MVYKGAAVPYGFKVEDKQLLIHEQEIKFIKLVYHLHYNLFLPIREIINVSEEIGFRSRYNKKLSTSTIHSILNKEIYLREDILSKELIRKVNRAKEIKNKRLDIQSLKEMFEI